MNELIWRRAANQDIGCTLLGYSAAGRTLLMAREWFTGPPPNFITPAIIADIKARLAARCFAAGAGVGASRSSSRAHRNG